MALSEGPYASGLTDPLAGVAQIYKQRGQYDEAIESYRRALHVIRVNDGLKSERQLPLLKDLMAIYRIVGDGQALDDAYHYYFNIHGNGYPPYTEASIAANVEYMAWQREAFGVKIGGKAQSRARAVQAYLRNAQMIEEMAAQTSPNVDWYEDIVMSQMANLYMVMGEDLEEHMSVGMPSGAMYGSELQSEAFVRDRISVIQGTGEKVGRKLIQSLIDMRPEAPATKRAALYLELGDWNQWNGSLRRANEAYSIVETLLLAENEHELLENWLAEPMELPDERALWRSASGLSRERHPVMTVRYDVSEKGDVRNVSVSQSDASASWPANRLKRLLRETHFRPRFAGGQPLAATNLERNYQVLD
jgi:tetratricopeptide (TPR) repeat protein